MMSLNNLPLCVWALWGLRARQTLVRPLCVWVKTGGCYWSQSKDRGVPGPISSNWGAIRGWVGESLSVDGSVVATRCVCVPACHLLDSDCVFHSPGVWTCICWQTWSWTSHQVAGCQIQDRVLGGKRVCASTSRGLVNVQCKRDECLYVCVWMCACVCTHLSVSVKLDQLASGDLWEGLGSRQESQSSRWIMPLVVGSTNMHVFWGTCRVSCVCLHWWPVSDSWRGGAMAACACALWESYTCAGWGGFQHSSIRMTFCCHISANMTLWWAESHQGTLTQGLL